MQEATSRYFHRHKLLRIAAQLGNPFLYTEVKLLERIRAFANEHGLAAQFEPLARRAFLTDDLHDIGRAGRVHEARPGDTAFIQFSSGSTSDPKGVVLTHGNVVANLRGATKAEFNHCSATDSLPYGQVGMNAFGPLPHDF